jgi:hypothetical protein
MIASVQIMPLLRAERPAAVGKIFRRAALFRKQNPSLVNVFPVGMGIAPILECRGRVYR